MSIEKFLTRKFAKEHSLKHHGIFGTLTELFFREEKLKKQFNSEASNSDDFRENLIKALGTTPAEKKLSAERWAIFLKTRIPVLKFWSTLFTTFITIYGLGTTIFTLADKVNGSNGSYGLISAFLVVTLILILLKYQVDKKSFWYEYITSNLDAVSKLVDAKELQPLFNQKQAVEISPTVSIGHHAQGEA